MPSDREPIFRDEETEGWRGSRFERADRWGPNAPWIGIRTIVRGLRIRLVATGLLLAGGLLGLVAYLIVLARLYPWYVNLAVGLATLGLIPLAILGMWIAWGLSMR